MFKRNRILFGIFAASPLLYYYTIYSSNSFTNMTIEEKIKNENHLSFYMKETRKSQHFPFYYAFKHPNAQVLRFYTPLQENNRLKFIVKVYPSGLFSNYLIQADNVEIKGPFYHPEMIECIESCLKSPQNRLLCISGGTGILPFIQLQQHYPQLNIDIVYCGKSNLLDYLPNQSQLNIIHTSSLNLKKCLKSLKPSHYDHLLVCGPDKFSNYLCGYDNEEHYSLKRLYEQEQNIYSSTLKKQLGGLLKELGCRSDATIVL